MLVYWLMLQPLRVYVNNLFCIVSTGQTISRYSLVEKMKSLTCNSFHF